jgi:hypothetical protein
MQWEKDEENPERNERGDLTWKDDKVYSAM